MTNEFYILAHSMAIKLAIEKSIKSISPCNTLYSLIFQGIV